MRRLWYYIRVALSGHLLNPLWLPRLERRRVRGRAYRRAGMDYLRPYAAAVRDVPEDKPDRIRYKVSARDSNPIRTRLVSSTAS